MSLSAANALRDALTRIAHTSPHGSMAWTYATNALAAEPSFPELAARAHGEARRHPVPQSAHAAALANLKAVLLEERGCSADRESGCPICGALADLEDAEGHDG